MKKLSERDFLLVALVAGGCGEEDPGVSTKNNPEYVTGEKGAEVSPKGEKEG